MLAGTPGRVRLHRVRSRALRSVAHRQPGERARQRCSCTRRCCAGRDGRAGTQSFLAMADEAFAQGSRLHVPRVRRWTVPAALAAGVVMVALVVRLSSDTVLTRPETVAHFTAEDSRRDFTLSDGSVVHLDVESEVSTKISAIIAISSCFAAVRSSKWRTRDPGPSSCPRVARASRHWARSSRSVAKRARHRGAHRRLCRRRRHGTAVVA